MNNPPETPHQAPTTGTAPLAAPEPSIAPVEENNHNATTTEAPQETAPEQNVTRRERRILRLLHRLDLLIGGGVVLAILLGISIWRTPLLIPTREFIATADWVEPLEAPTVYKLLGLPARFYIRLPRTIDNRYEWFSVDMRQETVTLLTAPPATTHWFGLPAIHRSDRLGLDLEFRTLDSLEWTITFESQRVSFTNSRLTLTLTPD